LIHKFTFTLALAWYSTVVQNLKIYEWKEEEETKQRGGSESRRGERKMKIRKGTKRETTLQSV
jgi:hypothetical protein